MGTNPTGKFDTTGSTDRLDDVVEDVIRRRAAGEQLDDAAVVAAHSDLLPRLAERLRSLRLVERAEQVAGSDTGIVSDLRLAGSGSGSAGTSPPRSASIPGYTVISEIQRGGQGVVYKGHQQSTDRTVAIKVMHEGPFAGPRDKQRFDREVRILAQLKHPNIVTIYDSGVASGCFYFVMDYVSGRSLDDFTTAHRLGINATVELFAKICETVNAAHLLGVIHRDLKPSNVRVDDHGQPHVLDFGLAKMESEGHTGVVSQRSLTCTGQFVGSLPWASPEQANGAADAIDIRTDVYSLGVMLYYGLTGAFPYQVVGTVRDVLGQILEAEPKPPRSVRKEIDDEIETIVLKCLAKDTARRYQTAGQVGQDLRRYLAGEPIEAKRDSTLYVLRKQMQRHRIPLVGATGILLLIIGSSVVAWSLYGQARQNLWASYLAQARAIRATDTPGRRYGALEALGKAAEIRSSIELRNEAIAAMALTDLRVERRPGRSEGAAVHFLRGFSPSGNLDWIYDITAGTRTVRDLSTREAIFTLPGATPGVEAAQPRFSPDGRYVACATESGFGIWDARDGRRVKQADGRPNGRGIPFDFAPHADELAVGTQSGSVEIHGVHTADKRELPASGSAVYLIQCAPGGDVLATASLRDKDVLIRDANSGTILHTLAHPHRAWSMDWSADGSRIAIGCENGSVYIWNARTGIQELAVAGHMSAVSYLGYNQTNTLLFSASWDGTSRFLDPRTGAHLLTLPAATVRFFEPESNRLTFTTGWSHFEYGTATITLSRALRTLVAAQSHAVSDYSRAVAVNGDGRLLASASDTGVWIWDLSDGHSLAKLPTRLTSVVLFEDDDSSLITGSEEGIWRWPLQFSNDFIRIGPPTLLFLFPNYVPNGGCLSNSGRTLLLAEHDQGRALVFDLDEKRISGEIGPHDSMSSISASPDGKWLATGTWGGSAIKIWDGTNGELFHDLPANGSANVGFSPDGKWLVTSDADHVIWRVGSWTEAARIPRVHYASLPSPIAFSPDGNVLALADGGPPFTLVLVNLRNMQPIASLACPKNMVMPQSLTFTPDGTQLVFPNGHNAHIIFSWDLREIRSELAQMELDWNLPPYPPASLAAPPRPLRADLNLGGFPAQP